MNPPPRPPSRFIRGRARGGGAYRPYFYFRRNGRTIPAGGNPGVGNRGRFNQRGRGGAPSNNKNAAPLANDFSASLLRPDHCAIPENALQVESFAIETPLPTPAWRLYFPAETFDECSELAKRIKAVEAHYATYMAIYDFIAIGQNCYFTLKARVIRLDEKLLAAWPTLFADMQQQPMRTLATFGVAMHSTATLAALDVSLSMPACSKVLYVSRFRECHKIYVRPEGFMDAAVMSHATTDQVEKLYCVRGAAVSVGDADISASWVAYQCTRCRQEMAFKQSGNFVSKPHCCKRAGCLAKTAFIEQRSSIFTQITPKQSVRLLEHNLQAPVRGSSSAADYLDIELRYDLVDAVATGQDVIITGVLKMLPLTNSYEGPSTSNKCCAQQFYLKAVAVKQATQLAHTFTKRDLEAITMINEEPDSFKLLVHSLAPAVHGQELMKAGVLLSLLGGSASHLQEESVVNVLLVGDPGLGKSHILQMCAQISGNGILFSGKSSSSSTNQLFASVKKVSSNLTLDAGAILSSRVGHCAIDDIDSLASQQDSLLQVVQSQSLALPFSQIYSNLTAPTAIIAAANSLRGHYDHSKLLVENVRINASLLQEFHLVFLMLDKPNKDLDTSLTEHIRALHSGEKRSSTIAARYAMQMKKDYSMNSMDFSEENDENYDLAARLKLKWTADMQEEELDLLPAVLIKKFITYAREQVKPLLDAEAAEVLKTFYMELREQKDEENTPVVGISHLEGLVRLTQARARIDFSSVATKEHVRDVLAIVRHSIADTVLGNYVDINPATTAATSSKSTSGMAKKFLQIVQVRSGALGRRVFDFDELKELARRAGISCGITNLVDIINMQGYLLKRGPNIYELMEE